MSNLIIKRKLKTKIDNVTDNYKLMLINEAVDEILEENTLKWDSLSESEKQAIFDGIEQLEKGEYVYYEDMKKEFDKWKKT